MLRLSKFRILLLGAIIALALGVTTVSAKPMSPTTPLDQIGDPNAAGVNVISRVLGGGQHVVDVRLNKGGREANFNVILRGVEAEAIGDQFFHNQGAGLNAVDGDHADGIVGPCSNDELATNVGKSGNVAMAKFITCGAHDTMRIKLSSPAIGNGAFPAIKIVFTGGVLVNVDGVFAADDPANVGNSWIPLFGP